MHKFAILQLLSFSCSPTQPSPPVGASAPDLLVLSLQVNMNSLLYFLALQHLTLVSTLEGSYEVGLSADAAFLESCIDLTSLYEAISHLQTMRTVFSQYADNLKGPNAYLASLALKFERNLDSELSSISRKLKQYGFVRDVNFHLNNTMSRFYSAIGGRSKRGAFDFVSEGASYHQLDAC